MMNKKNNVGGIFIILIPVFVIAILIVIDTAVNYTQEKTYKTITENIIRDVYSNDDITYEEYDEEIKKLYELRGYETDKLVVIADSYSTTVENEHAYYGVFSSLFGNGEEEYVKLFGFLDVKMKKGSRTIIKVQASYDYDDELRFEYVE